jgi:hypothetical protein
MMTPEQIEALHETNDFLSVTLARLRTYQSRVTQMLATATQQHETMGTDLAQLERLLTLRRIPYAKMAYNELPHDESELTVTDRVDLAITTAFQGSNEDDDVINIEFQFDGGLLIGLRTLLGKRV